ncbi:MAG: polymer-forming cytoskeletal protein [Desulfobacterota bacterium]|nr:polymer-forming cytoskeletal protein [Thermodesulfobacteriota bacterium]
MSGRSIFSKGEAKTQAVCDEISAFLGKETFFEGKMTFRGIFRLDGRFEGEIFDSGTLIVGETAMVRGKIAVHTIVINGQVEGELHAIERAEIHATGKFTGSLFTPKLIIQEGGLLNGHCEMSQRVSGEEHLRSHPSQTPSPYSIS